MKIFKWLAIPVLAVLSAWLTDIFGLGFRALVPSPLVVCRSFRICPAAPKDMACSSEARQRQKAPPGFDAGLSQYPQAWVRIDDDEFCDYCRTVGNDDARQIWCTLGTQEGLTGTTLKSGVIDAGYPETAKWINFKDTGAPAYSRVVGFSREKRFVTPVYPGGFGDQEEWPGSQ